VQIIEDREVWYIALVRLEIQNAPGAVPPKTPVAKGERFQMDGDEITDLAQLLRVRAVQIYTGSPVQERLREDALKAMEFKRKNETTGLGKFRNRS